MSALWLYVLCTVPMLYINAYMYKYGYRRRRRRRRLMLLHATYIAKMFEIQAYTSYTVCRHAAINVVVTVHSLQ